MKSIREQQQERRDEKLAGVQRAVDSGSLVIRKMTPAERKVLPALPAQPKKARSTGARTASRRVV